MFADLILWDHEDDLAGNYRHIVGTGEVTADEVDDVIHNHQGGPHGFSQSTGCPLIYGWTSSGRHIVVVYRDESEDDLVIIRPITAYPVKEYGDFD